MTRLAIYLSLALLVFCGSVLDSPGWAGYIALVGVLASYVLLVIAIRAERKAEQQERQLKKVA